MSKSFRKILRVKINLKMIRNLILFIGLIVFTFWFIFKDQDMNELFRIVNSADDKYLLLGIIMMLLYFLTEAYNIRSVLKSLGEKISLLSALKFTWIGFFFSSITPAATGGQPVEVYYMTKENIPGAKGTMALLIELCGFQISTISLAIICAIINPTIVSGGLLALYFIGLLINGFALSLMLIVIFSQKLTKKLINVLVKMLHFFKVKDVEEKKKKFEDSIEKYNECSIYIKTHKKEFIKAILRVFLQIVFYYSVPYCVYRSFGLNTYNFFQIFTMQAVLYTTVSSLPLPGAIGVSESVFLSIFGVVFGKELLSGAMLLNRGITFYLFVVVALVVVIVNAINKKNVKGEIDKKVIELDEELATEN